MYTIRAQPDAPRKRLHCHLACSLWKLLFDGSVPDLQKWMDYVQCVRDDVEGINRDEWNMSLALFKRTQLSRDAWPLLILHYIQ